MKLVRNLIVVLITMVLVGLAKAPYDEKVAADMRERRLLPKPIELDTWEELGQTGLAIALGGLRSMIASMLNIRAYVHWENQEWYELEQTYNTIVALQPETRYYWTAAAWHLSSNAYADYETKPDIPDGRRRRIQKEFFWKGMAFLERAVEAYPEDARLWSELGSALSQVWRPRDLARAAEAYHAAFELNGNLQAQRQHLYVLSRIPGREAEAWKFGRAMWANPENRKFNSPRDIYYALQSWAKPPRFETHSIGDIFGSRAQAALLLPDYWCRQQEGYPMHGVREAINELCEEFLVPELIHPLRFDPDRLFRIHPVTGESFPNSPITGKPIERRWRSIWLDQLRSEYRAHIRSIYRAPP